MKIKVNSLRILITIFIISLIVAGFLVFRKNHSNDNYCINSITQEKLIFIYSPGCIACQLMKPIMEKRNDTYWLNIQSDRCLRMLKDMKLNVKYIPTFVCTKNMSISISGVRNEQAINSWIEENC